MNHPSVAFKEWAVICRALATGRQGIILRKGGIAEAGNVFRVEHDRFWLLPTFVHQQQEGIIEAYRPLLEEAILNRPPEGTLRLQYLAEVKAVHQITTPEQAESLADLHGWSATTVQSRFHYRQPGLFVLVVRLWQANAVIEIPDRSEYAGCKSWVPLNDPIPPCELVALTEEAKCERLQSEVTRRLRR